MKTLCIIRHAKSSWPLGMADFDRPLNERGKKDAPEMGKRLLKRKIPLDILISSPANRAYTTCTLFANELNYALDKIELVPELYHAPSTTFVNVVQHIDNKYNAAAIFSHNPGITDFVNSLLENVKIDNMPTSGIYAITSVSENWSSFFTSELRFLFFDYPKLH